MARFGPTWLGRLEVEDLVVDEPAFAEATASSSAKALAQVDGGGRSLERTRLRCEFPVKQGKYREFS